MSKTPGLNLPYGIDPVNPVPVDSKYGPYASTAEAITAVPLASRYDGLTVQITGTGEYHWLQADLSDTGLVLKTSASTAQIIIPKPLLKVNKDYVAAYYLPQSFQESFLNYNPKYFLFVYKAKKISKKRNPNINSGLPYKVIKPAGFYHPTHHQGADYVLTPGFYGGATEISLDTEFPLTPGSYVKTVLGFNPFQFCKFNAGGFWRFVLPTDFPCIPSLLKFQGGRSPGVQHGSQIRTLTCCIAIGITNPNTGSNKPIVFGELSQPFRVKYDAGQSSPGSNTVSGFIYELVQSGIKRRSIPI